MAFQDEHKTNKGRINKPKKTNKFLTKLRVNRDWVKAVFAKRENQCSYLGIKHFCKNDKKEGSSYCESCHKKAYVPDSTRESRKIK